MKKWLTVAEGAEYSGVSRDTIYAVCERREFASRARGLTSLHSSETRMDRRMAGAACAGLSYRSAWLDAGWRIVTSRKEEVVGLYKLCEHKGRARDRCEHAWWARF